MSQYPITAATATHINIPIGDPSVEQQMFGYWWNRFGVCWKPDWTTERLARISPRLIWSGYRIGPVGLYHYIRLGAVQRTPRP